MHEINRHNYEAFYLDFLEGRLNKKDTEQLLMFLDKNPELKAGLEDLSLIEIKPDTNVKFDKESLKQNIDSDNLDDYLIASIENIIDEYDAQELNEYLEHSAEARTLAERYRKTILPKPEIRFPEKEKLKKNSKTVYYLVPLLTAAATLLILLWINIRQDGLDTSTLMTMETSVIEKNNSVDPAMEDKSSLTNTTNPDQDIKPLFSSVKKEQEVLADLNEEKTIADHQPAKRSDTDLNVNDSIKTITPVLITNIRTDKQQSIALVYVPITESGDNEDNETEASQTGTAVKSSRDMNLLTVAEVAVRIFGKLNERDYDVEPNYTTTGEIKSVTIMTNKRKITTTAI